MTKTSTRASQALTVLAIPGIPLIEDGTSIGDVILDACSASGIELQDQDVLILQVGKLHARRGLEEQPMVRQ